MDVDHDDPDFLSVRETAERLAVHENTVRNWARQGILPTAKIPGSRFHRFDSRDVERLRKRRGAVVSSVAPERRTIGPELVDGTQLNQWAGTRDAHDQFPELVRRLLASTPGITNVSVRAGEGVSVPGWDGRAESTGTDFLPHGSLCFEFGAGRDPKKKADEDYEKRRDDPLGVVAAEAVFAFITPRRWSRAERWASERSAEGVFRDVQVLDADDLEGWLQATPAVHHWISEELGRRPRDAETLERWWSRFRAQTDPPLPPELFLTGRDSERARLTAFFGQPPGAITVQAACCREAIAFICATIDRMEGEADSPVQPPLIISSAEVWDRVVQQPGRMTLLPLFENPDLAAAQDRGHHVALPVGRDQIVRGPKLELPPPDRQGANQALEAVGIESDRADKLAALARRSMPSLVRMLARDPRFARPRWSEPPAAPVLAPLVLAGAWTLSDADTAIVSRMADEEWPAIERTLAHWQNSDDPPFVRPANQWHVASAEEAFLVLRHALTTTDLERWREIAIDVLLEPDPTLDLTPEDRSMAGVMGVGRKYSSVLRRGLAEGVALVSSIGDEGLANGVSGDGNARRIVRELLEAAEADSSGQVWRSLAYELPLLAEAAPQVFLDALHDDLERTEPLLATMFQDNDQSSILHGSSPHTGLLWAVETLCWSPEYLVEASRALARLQVVDPGGRLTNRPLASLEHVLVGWIRHTAASLEVRVEALEAICRDLPDIGWRLLLGLWPSIHSTSSPPSGPRFHDWKPQSRGVQISEWIEFIGHLVRLALGLAGDDPERWAELAEHLAPLPPAERDRLTDALDAFGHPESLTPDQRMLLWERLHKEISKHRKFASAEWSMDEGPLARLQEIANRLEPRGNVERFGYLFDWRPDLPGIDPYDHDTYDRELLKLQTGAVTETLEQGSTEALKTLAERAPVPRHLGWIVGAVARDELTPELLPWLESPNQELRDVVSTWAARKLQDEGVAWLRAALGRPEMTTTERRTALALHAPATREVWDALAEIDVDLNNAYWAGMTPWRVAREDTERAARELLGHNRPWAAIDLLASEAHRRDDEHPTALAPSLVQDVLDAAMDADPTGADTQSLGYEIGLLLDYLEGQGCPSEALVRWEFVFFRLLNDHRTPRALFDALSSDPSLFVDLVQRVYRGKNEPRRQLEEHEEALAHHASWILLHWRDLPGRREDGTVAGEHLRRWVQDARLALAESDRADIGDEQIGQILAMSPPGTDGIWPAEPVRDILETIGSTSMETGIHVGRVNARGVTSRGVFEGGERERTLAAQYRVWAKQTASRWRRTSRVLRGLAESYEQDAAREDERAAIRADTE
jgi:excisionase family DNA binding protein